MILTGKKRTLDLSYPQVMGILNVTPDSFSDGSQFQSVEKALQHAADMVAEGAAIIDIGGESTRPGAAYVSEQEELDRVVPVIEKIAQELDVMISVDTYKPTVMTAACAAGAHLINDIKALQEDGALDAAKKSEALVCLMHMQGTPDTMQIKPSYQQSVTQDVAEFLHQRAQICIHHGIPIEKIIFDPGFGFGKTVEQNYQLLGQLNSACAGFPILVGMSRKSMIGNLLNRPIDQRLAGSIGAALFAVAHGARIIRVHDVQATKDAIDVYWHAQQYQSVHTY